MSCISVSRNVVHHAWKDIELPNLVVNLVLSWNCVIVLVMCLVIYGGYAFFHLWLDYHCHLAALILFE